MQNSHYPLIAAFTLVQIAVIFIFGYTPYPDSEGYILLARQCLEHGESYPVTALLHDYPFLWNIGSIQLVTVTLKLFGTLTPLLVFYALLKGATAWLCYDIARQLTDSRRVALVTLLLYILYPANYGEATSVLGEVPFIFLSLSAVWLCVARHWLVAAGIVLAVAGWVRPFALVFLGALLLFLLWRQHWQPKQSWQPCLRLIGGYVGAVLLIGTLAYARTGLFLYQAKTGWMALMQYSWDNSDDHSDFPVNPETIGQDAATDVAEKDAAWRSMFFSWVSRHPVEYLRQMPAKLVNTYASDNINFCAFLPEKTTREYMYEELSLSAIKSALPKLTPVQWLTVVNLLFYYALLLMALLSLRHFSPSIHLLPVAVISLGTLMLLFVGHGEARFHQPLMPFFIMMSASFLFSLQKNE